MKPVYILPNGKPLGASDFCRYFEKKVLYAVRKFSMPMEVKVKKSDSVNSKVLQALYEKFGFMNKGSKVIALDDCCDDISTMLLESWFANKEVNLASSTKKEIRPLFLMTEQEISIYAAIKHIAGKPKKKSEARKMLDSMEKPHPEVKRAIVQAYLQLLEIRNRN